MMLDRWVPIAPHLELRVTARHETLVVRARGDIDRASAAPFAEAFHGLVRDRRTKRAVIALSELDFMDLAGGRVLREVADVLHASGRRLVVLDPPRIAQLVLAIVGLSERVWVDLLPTGPGGLTTAPLAPSPQWAS